MSQSMIPCTEDEEPGWQMKPFRDHAGRSANRLRFVTEDSERIPDDFKRPAVFPLQVYTTFPIERSDLESLGNYLGDTLSDSERPSVIWEVYEAQADRFACVDHQKREIAHRKACSDRTDTLLIPKVPKGKISDWRRYGFCITFTSPSFQRPWQESVDPNGALWVWFERSFHAADSHDAMRRMAYDPGVPQLAAENVELPERLEMEAERKQRRREIERELAQLYFWSCAPDDTGFAVEEITLALDEDEGQPPTASDLQAWATDSNLAEFSSLLTDGAFDMQQRNGNIVISSTKTAEPDLRYLICVLLPEEHADKLEQWAKAFTCAIGAQLPGKTISFEFFRPPQPQLSAVFNSQPPLPANYIGASVNGRRLHPLSRKADAWHNNPDTSPIEPYRSFLVVIDKAIDFTTGAGVLFVLTDGGKQRHLGTDVEGYFSGPTFDYVETAVWRSSGIESLACRLAMEGIAD